MIQKVWIKKEVKRWVDFDMNKIISKIITNDYGLLQTEYAIDQIEDYSCYYFGLIVYFELDYRNF